MKKRVPNLKTDREAEEFLEQDLSDYIALDQFTQLSFEFLPKTEKVNLRFPKPLLDAVKAQAAREGIPYQKYIRLIVEKALIASER